MKFLPELIKGYWKKSILKAVGADKLTTEGFRVIIVTGDNASGKSMLRRLLTAACKTEEIECIHLSAEGRRSGGIGACFIYGDESWEATGVLSYKTITGGFRTSAAREKDHILIYDEPEIGMSEETQLACAKLMADELSKDCYPHLRGVVVMTHSRHFVKALYLLEHTCFCNLGNKWASASDWLNRRLFPTDLETLVTSSMEKFREINALLNAKVREPKQKE